MADWHAGPSRGARGARLWRALAQGLLVAGLLALAVERFLWAGLTFDEPAHLKGLEAVLDFAAQALRGEAPDFAALPGDLEFYGIGALQPAYVLTGLLDGLSDRSELLRWSQSVHLVAQLSFLVCLWATWRLLRRVSPPAALYGTLLLALLPEFLGHGLFNYKDMPVAAGVAVALDQTLLFLATRRKAALVGLALAAAWLGAQKLAALLLIGPLPLAVLVVLVRAGRRDLWLAAGGAAAASLLLLFAATPVAWVDPLGYLRAALDYMSRHAWNGCMLTDGRCIGKEDTDWSPLTYLWEWSLAKLPLSYLLAFALAVGLVLRRPNATAGLALATLLCFLVAIAIRGSTLYDGLRHVLFLLPLGVCVVAASGLFAPRAARLVAALVLAWLAFENARFYPYNYAWFTPLKASAAAANRYDTDYWGYSLRAAADRLPPAAAIAGVPDFLLRPFLPVPPPDGTWPRYLVRFNRWVEPLPAGCAPYDALARHTLLGQRIVMSFVARCDAPP